MRRLPSIVFRGLANALGFSGGEDNIKNFDLDTAYGIIDTTWFGSVEQNTTVWLTDERTPGGAGSVIALDLVPAFPIVLVGTALGINGADAANWNGGILTVGTRTGGEEVPVQLYAENVVTNTDTRAILQGPGGVTTRAWLSPVTNQLPLLALPNERVRFVYRAAGLFTNSVFIGLLYRHTSGRFPPAR